MTAPAQYDAEFSTFLTALGHLNYSFSNTESLLIHLIAGLLGTSKDAATIVFLTLNTTRARIDLVDRLAKQDSVAPELRDKLLAATGDLARQAPLRNRLNHCIYAFDSQSGQASSILMRIADRRKEVKIGQEMRIDADATDKVRAATESLHALNLRLRTLIVEAGFPT
ncbi:hypothetical protein ILP92_06275 [Maribius pontilimi]|uniref:Uncharacterized protein n=1 Tax=Palleronia pontilimi TaxID=1964209 RepID=A0A934MDG3_9RHOB|nr:hypothetical protein [Palleronia pontilimi]MBJ3762346.1 hypothetical protein [Palleronia pontilimi]